ncbi:hepatic triacylglycerol lipase [Tachyglossus aculeatus]|uniref:hepatic triacylglycerol lipase n=1 Tax=Tachyglossus aculeatus TaxID=9261 RepID=UPI0018F3BC0C|nr:hepatic triacylglycerol lipase [Tachyglossus aculeatus]
MERSHGVILCFLLCLLLEASLWGLALAGPKEAQIRTGPTQIRPDRTQTRFLLFTASGDVRCHLQLGHAGSLDQCGFNASLPLVIIVHGWSVDGLLENWIWKMADAFKSQTTGPVNVVVADWLSLAHQHYAIAVRNTRHVGQDIARFLEWLEDAVHLPRSRVHLIGYSLGAHVSGFAGSSIRGPAKIGRITGLDAAGPMFEGTSPADRLSPDDATLVDAIHTFTMEHMGLSVGINQPVAHYDFYPNGGTFQPGCHFLHMYRYIAKHGINGIAENVKCAHERSVHLFIDSLLPNALQSTAYSCSNIHTFKRGLCLSCDKGRCNILGYHIRPELPRPHQNNPKRFFLLTRAHAPFKVYHYQVKIQFINEMGNRVEPIFALTLIGTKGVAPELSITPAEGISGNKTCSFLVPLQWDVGELTTLQLRWEDPVPWAGIWDAVQALVSWAPGSPHPLLTAKTIRIKAGETQQKMIFCPQNPDDPQLRPAQEKTYIRCEARAKRTSL